MDFHLLIVISATDSPLLRASRAVEENKALLVSHPVPVQSSSVHRPEKPADIPQQSHHVPAGRGRGGRGPQRGKGQRGGQNNLKESHRSTLLEMVRRCWRLSNLFISSLFHTIFYQPCVLQLLAPDIRHERNVILQCVRYVVRKGFFGLAGRDSNEITTVSTRDSASGDTSTRDDGERSDATSRSLEELNDTGFPQRSSAASDESVPSPDAGKQPSVFLQLFAHSLVCEEPVEDSQDKDLSKASQMNQNASTEAVDEAEDRQRCQNW